MSERLSILAVALVAAAVPGVASAHVGSGGWILLLPTHLYIAGGALVVVASFVLAALVPARVVLRLESAGMRLAIGRLGAGPALATASSLVSLAAAIALVVAGRLGSRDPTENPLPLFVWSVWWIGFTYLHAAAGNVWSVLNPWRGLHRLLTAAGPLASWRERPPLAYPAWAAHWPAVVTFLPFAWFELVHPSPADPAVLAGLVAGYLVLHLLGVLYLGERWLERGEAFSVFFRMVSWLAPAAVRTVGAGAERRREIEVTVPGLRLLRQPVPDPSLVALVLVVLASVSFDGLSRTFAWLALLGENPLVHPGRTALVPRHTLGLLGTIAVLSLAYAAAARLSARLAAAAAPAARAPRSLALSLVPIAFGYHSAHYLPVFLVDVQQALRAASDPFGRGWDLLGTRDLHVVASLLSDPGWVYAIWHAQVAVIVGAHVAGVAVAHALVLRLGGRAATAMLSQLPLLVLMIGYTMLGLWLLSSPTAG